MMLKCTVCGREAKDAESALDEGWLPYFIEGLEDKGPCCPDCFDALMYEDKDGEPRLKDEFKGRIIYANELRIDQDPEPHFCVVYN